MKYGTKSDISQLPRLQRNNKPHATKWTLTAGKRRRTRKVAKAGAGKRNVITLTVMESEGEEAAIDAAAAAE